MFQRPGFFGGGFLLAAEHHGHAARGSEFDDHVRTFVGDPDVVLIVDLDRVRIGPGVKVVANLSHKCSIRLELQQLRGACAVGWAGTVAS